MQTLTLTLRMQGVKCFSPHSTSGRRNTDGETKKKEKSFRTQLGAPDSQCTVSTTSAESVSSLQNLPLPVPPSS